MYESKIKAKKLLCPNCEGCATSTGASRASQQTNGNSGKEKSVEEVENDILKGNRDVDDNLMTGASDPFMISPQCISQDSSVASASVPATSALKRKLAHSPVKTRENVVEKEAAGLPLFREEERKKGKHMLVMGKEGARLRCTTCQVFVFLCRCCKTALLAVKPSDVLASCKKCGFLEVTHSRLRSVLELNPKQITLLEPDTVRMIQRTRNENLYSSFMSSKYQNLLTYVMKNSSKSKRKPREEEDDDDGDGEDGDGDSDEEYELVSFEDIDGEKIDRMREATLIKTRLQLMQLRDNAIRLEDYGRLEREPCCSLLPRFSLTHVQLLRTLYDSFRVAPSFLGELETLVEAGLENEGMELQKLSETYETAYQTKLMRSENDGDGDHDCNSDNIPFQLFKRAFEREKREIQKRASEVRAPILELLLAINQELHALYALSNVLSEPGTWIFSIGIKLPLKGLDCAMASLTAKEQSQIDAYRSVVGLLRRAYQYVLKKLHI